jgi:hypothetical protein
MKKLAILSLVLLPAAALADDDTGSSQARNDDPDRIVCRNISEIGSRLARRRICQTQEQWDEQRRLTRADMENRQTRNCLGRCAE